MKNLTESGIRPVELHILLAVAETPLHGYGIIKATEEATEGEVELEPGTLYRALRRLKVDALVREVRRPPQSDSDDPRRRYYQITATGKRVLRGEMKRYAQILASVRARRLFPDLGSR